MTMINVGKISEKLTMTITAEFAAPPERVWQVWSDPRQLERWWGPPDYPATVVGFDLRPGGSVSYYMTGPEGEKYRGWWHLRSVDAPHHLEFEDGFADDAGNPDPNKPITSARVTLTERPERGTRMEIVSVFDSQESMQQLIDMGVEEGMTSAVGQIDDLLSER